ncbi:MAG: DegV family protein [Anaerolineae bacterium]|nr:DegV family protein [Anaerolineae bacterium]
MANKVAIVTDSTAYIPKDRLASITCEIAPALVIWEGEDLRDGFDIQPDEFYKRLKTAKEMPTTSQPSPGAFKEVFEGLLAKGYDILGVFISSKLSGTFASAQQAKGMLPDANIELVDTLSASMGAGWPILLAGEAANKGASLAECKKIVEDAIKHVGVLLTVDTLEFFHRGGRISGVERFVGTALKFKPILELVSDGTLIPLEKARTRTKAINRLLELMVDRIGGRSPVYLASIHCDDLEMAKEVLERAKALVDVKDTLISPVSPAVGTHTGPGTIGLVFLAGYK